MILKLVWASLRNGKARFLCAIAGIAAATGALVFSSSLISTNSAQAPMLAARACVPWSAWSISGIEMRRGGGRNGDPRHPPERGAQTPPAPAPDIQAKPDLVLKAVPLTVDYRPGGRVLQGPPMMAFMAAAPDKNPYGSVSLAEGRWVDENSKDFEVVCVKNSMRRFGKQSPELGSELKFVGRKCTMSAKIVGYLEGGKLPPQFPYVFANEPAFAALAEEKIGEVSFYSNFHPETTESPFLFTPVSSSVVNAFKGDEQRRMDYATPLLIIAAVLTALSLLINSLQLSIESNRKLLAILRMVGLTRSGVVAFVAAESMISGLVGWLVGTVVSLLCLSAYVAFDPVAFPAGMAISWPRVLASLSGLPILIFLSVLVVLRSTLRVRAMDVASRQPRPRHHGMAITFACGFAAFVAVEVWGASLMRAFVPSPQWPDAIVSLLPGGASSFDVDKLRDIPGVERISELAPLQLFLKGGGNALFLAAEWLPDFTFWEGNRDEAVSAVAEHGAVVITRMMSKARDLHVGDELAVMIGRGESASEERLKIAGVVDLNWHMVTSRGLLRGLNRMPGMTDGPVFVSFDTLESLDFRPSPMVRMTHLWLDYSPAFLATNGVFASGRIVEKEIAKRLGNPIEYTVRLHARDEIADGTLAHGSDVIGQVARVPFVFLAILAIGFVAMLVAEADARRRELAVLRVVGATRLQLANRLAFSAVRTALLGLAVGIPVGAAVGWLFSIATASHWPGLPHYLVVPWQTVVEGGFGALVFTLVFAIPTAIALVKRQP